MLTNVLMRLILVSETQMNTTKGVRNMKAPENTIEIREETKKVFLEIIPMISDEGCRKLLTMGEGIKFGMQAMAGKPEKTA